MKDLNKLKVEVEVEIDTDYMSEGGLITTTGIVSIEDMLLRLRKKLLKIPTDAYYSDEHGSVVQKCFDGRFGLGRDAFVKQTLTYDELMIFSAIDTLLKAIKNQEGIL